MASHSRGQTPILSSLVFHFTALPFTPLLLVSHTALGWIFIKRPFDLSSGREDSSHDWVRGWNATASVAGYSFSDCPCYAMNTEESNKIRGVRCFSRLYNLTSSSWPGPGCDEWTGRSFRKWSGMQHVINTAADQSFIGLSQVLS